MNTSSDVVPLWTGHINTVMVRSEWGNLFTFSALIHKSSPWPVIAEQAACLFLNDPLLMTEFNHALPAVYKETRPNDTYIQAWNAANIGNESLLPLPMDRTIPLPILAFLHH